MNWKLKGKFCGTRGPASGLGECCTTRRQQCKHAHHEPTVPKRVRERGQQSASLHQLSSGVGAWAAGKVADRMISSADLLWWATAAESRLITMATELSVSGFIHKSFKTDETFCAKKKLPIHPVLAELRRRTKVNTAASTETQFLDGRTTRETENRWRKTSNRNMALGVIMVR